MNDGVEIPSDLWKDIRGFFLPLIAPCKDCVRGNLNRCWHSDCAAFQFRYLGMRIADIGDNKVRKPHFAQIEDEIIDILRREGKPVYPSCIILATTKSKANKCSAINRLIRRGVIVETRINDYTRMISLKSNQT